MIIVNLKKEKGITLMALLIMIIILLILSGIAIATLTGENGIIYNAEEAKLQTEIENEKEILEKAVIQSMAENSRGILKQDILQNKLNEETSEGKTEVIDLEDQFEIIFTDSNRYYEVDKNGNIGKYQEIIKDKNPGDITVGKNGEKLDGTENYPYEIWCIEDLIDWSKNYSRYYASNIELCGNLNFKSKLSYANSESIEYGDINNDNNIQSLMEEMQTGAGFPSIENFEGNFNGKNYKISNIFINQEEHTGFIDRISGANVENLLLNGILEGSKDIGGIAARGGGTINNCHVNIKVNLNKEDNIGNSGGIIGTVDKNTKIINCSTEGELKGNNSGGIVGWSWEYSGSNCNIFNSYNVAKISGNNAGGIIGLNSYSHDTKVYNCLNMGNIDGAIKGGIVGRVGTLEYEIVKIYNSFYLNDSEKDIGNLNELQAIKFDKDNLKEQIDNLNKYIESSDEIDTSLWKKWKINNEFPMFQ